MIPKRGSYTGQSYKLYDDYNDVHIFIEDSGFENLYKVLFNKNGVKIENIFSKNGKVSVLETAAVCSDKKCVFIVDRDWDDYHGTLSELNNVVTLNMHSIENYLIDNSAFSGIIIAELPRCEIDDILNTTHFVEILSSVSDKLRPLFECFVAMQMADVREKGCAHNPGYFQQENKSCAPDENKIATYIVDSGITVPQTLKDYFTDKILTQKGHGKYMLHFVWEGVRQKSKVGRIGMEKLKIRLAQLIDTQELRQIVEEVRTKAFA